MKKIIGLTGRLLPVLLFTACAPRQFSILAEPANGSPGDIVRIRTGNLTDIKNAKVTIGGETAFIISSADSTLTVMVPPSAVRVTKLNVSAGKQQGVAAFEIHPPATTRLWFSIKNNAVTFLERQPSNEDFIQNKSYSADKMMFEVFNAAGKILAVGYLGNPTEGEAPMADHKGLSKIEIKEEVKFNVNLPAFTDMVKIRFSSINASTQYKPKLLTEIAIPSGN